jgi:hypothetical protein
MRAVLTAAATAPASPDTRAADHPDLAVPRTDVPSSDPAHPAAAPTRAVAVPTSVRTGTSTWGPLDPSGPRHGPSGDRHDPGGRRALDHDRRVIERRA